MTDQSTPFPFSLSSQAEQERLWYAIQAAQVGTWHLDISQQQVWWDERCQELFGLPNQAVVAYSQLLSLVHPEDRAHLDAALQAAFDPSTSGYYDVQFRTVGASKEELRWLHCQGQAYVDVWGAAYRLSGVARDITVQVQLQQQLAASKARFRNVVLNSPTPTVLFVGRDLVIDTVNAPMLQIWGKDESVMGQSLPRIMPGLVNQPLLERLQRVYDAGQVGQHPESQASVAVDGPWQQSWFKFSYSPIYTQDGTIFGFIHTATDVTGEVLALQQLQHSEVRFRSLIEEAPVATCLLVGHSWQIEVANESMLAMCGKSKRVIGQALLTAFPEFRNQPILARLTHVLDAGETYADQGARAVFFRNGLLTTYYVDWAAKPLWNEQGEVYAVLVMATDVTQQVLAQQVIQRREEQQTFLLQLTDHLRNLTSPADVYYQTACRLGAYLRADRVGFIQDGTDEQSIVILPNYTDGVDDWQGHYSLTDYKSLPSAFDRQRTVVRDDIPNDPFLTPAQKEDHLKRQLGATLHQLLAPQGEPRTILFVHFQQAHHWTDDEIVLVEEVGLRLVIAAERAQAEQALRQSEQQYRLLAEQLEHRVTERTSELVQANQDLQRSNDNLQQFAYVASHDLQEPLRKIQSFSSLLKAQYGDQLSGAAVDYLQRITSAGARMSALIKDLLTYSRIATRQQIYGSVSLGTILENVLNTLDWQIEQTGARITVDALPVINGDETQLSQLFQNLISNALKFVPPGQTPQVRVLYAYRSLEELSDEVHLISQMPFYHQISIHDQGVGFDMKYLDRIFQVFQRLHNKNEFAGTGVGLAICQRVVENHGGAITAASKAGDGATFHVYLPA